MDTEGGISKESGVRGSIPFVTVGDKFDRVLMGDDATVDLEEAIKFCKPVVSPSSTAEEHGSSGADHVLPSGFELVVFVVSFVIGKTIFFVCISVEDRVQSTLFNVRPFVLLTSSVKRVTPALPSGV